MRKYIYRLSTVLLVLLLLTAGVSVPARAEAPQELTQAIIESFHTGQELDVSLYELTKTELVKIYYELTLSGQLPWFADQKFVCHMSESSGFVTAFIPQILDATQYDRNYYEQTVAEILAATVHEGMEPWEKALSVHDYLVAHYSYDDSHANRLGYDLLVKGSAVCSGYSYAYMDLMNRIGIPCRIVESKTMGQGTGHSWNLVNLDGNWYHVDLTWDDPTPNISGRVIHKYFLLTDEQMRSEAEEGHFGWETDIVCDSTDYQDGIWKGIDSQMIFPDGDTCIYRSRQDWNLYIRQRSKSSGITRTLHTQKPDYFDIGKGPLTYEHNGLALWNGRLYFSSVNVVYSMDPESGEVRMEYAYDIPANNKYIFGSYVDQDRLYLTLADCDFSLTSQQIPLESTDCHIHKYAPEIVPPTCLEQGYTRYTCACGVSYLGDFVPPAGHQYEAHVLKESTFGEEGLQELVCTVCGDSYTEPIPPMTVLDFVKANPVSIVLALAVPIVLFLVVFLCTRKKHKKK